MKEIMKKKKEIPCKKARKLVESTEIVDRIVLARAKLSPECADEIYPKLIEEKDVRVREGVAENENIPPECAVKIFPKLSEDEDPRVRKELARNEAIPLECWEEIFKRFERDGDQKVREALQVNSLYKAYKRLEQKGKRIV